MASNSSLILLKALQLAFSLAFIMPVALYTHTVIPLENTTAIITAKVILSLGLLVGCLSFLLSLSWVHFLASPKSCPASCHGHQSLCDTAVDTLLTILWLVVIALVGYALTGVEKLPIDKVPAEPVTALALALVLFILSVASLVATVSAQKQERAQGALPVTAAVHAAHDGPKDITVVRS